MSVQTPPYSPPQEMLAAAEKALSEATPAELAAAESLYMAYAKPTGGRSAVTGAELPLFAACKPLVRAGWLAAAKSWREPLRDYLWGFRMRNVSGAAETERRDGAGYGSSERGRADAALITAKHFAIDIER